LSTYIGFSSYAIHFLILKTIVMAKILLSIGLEGIPSIILLVFFLPIMIQSQEIEQIENLNNKEEAIWNLDKQVPEISANGFYDDESLAFINGIYVNNKNNLAKVFHRNRSESGQNYCTCSISR